MSRTKRKPSLSCYVESNVENYIKHARRWIYIGGLNYRQTEEEARKEYATYFRDGHWNLSNSNQGYKTYTNRAIRRNSKIALRRYIINGDEDVIFETKHDHKNRLWDWY